MNSLIQSFFYICIDIFNNTLIFMAKPGFQNPPWSADKARKLNLIAEELSKDDNWMFFVIVLVIFIIGVIIRYFMDHK